MENNNPEDKKEKDNDAFKIVFAWVCWLGIPVLIVKSEQVYPGSGSYIFFGVIIALFLWYLLADGVSKFGERLIGTISFLIILAVIVLIFGPLAKSCSSSSDVSPTDTYYRR